MYTICVTATRKRNVTRRERCAGLTGVTVAAASGRTIERRERSYEWEPRRIQRGDRGRRAGTHKEEGRGKEGIGEDGDVEGATEAEETCDEGDDDAGRAAVSEARAQRDGEGGTHPTNLYPSYASRSRIW